MTDTLTWTRNGRRLTVSRLEGKAARWREEDHPRDREGKFIETGAEVRIWGGALATVVANVGGGRIEVQTADGAHRIVHRNYLTVTKRPDGTAPTGAPEAAEAAPATGIPTRPDAQSVPDPASATNGAEIEQSVELVRTEMLGIHEFNDDGVDMSDALADAAGAYVEALNNGTPNDEADERATLLDRIDEVAQLYVGANPPIRRVSGQNRLAELREAVTAEPDEPGPLDLHAPERTFPADDGDVTVALGDTITFTADGDQLQGQVVGWSNNGGPVVDADGEDYPLVPDATRWQHSPRDDGDARQAILQEGVPAREPRPEGPPLDEEDPNDPDVQQAILQEGIPAREPRPVTPVEDMSDEDLKAERQQIRKTPGTRSGHDQLREQDITDELNARVRSRSNRGGQRDVAERVRAGDRMAAQRRERVAERVVAGDRMAARRRAGPRPSPPPQSGTDVEERRSWVDRIKDALNLDDEQTANLEDVLVGEGRDTAGEDTMTPAQVTRRRRRSGQSREEAATVARGRERLTALGLGGGDPASAPSVQLGRRPQRDDADTTGRPALPDDWSSWTPETFRAMSDDELDTARRGLNYNSPAQGDLFDEAMMEIARRRRGQDDSAVLTVNDPDTGAPLAEGAADTIHTTLEPGVYTATRHDDGNDVHLTVTDTGAQVDPLPQPPTVRDQSRTPDTAGLTEDQADLLAEAMPDDEQVVHDFLRDRQDDDRDFLGELSDIARDSGDTDKYDYYQRVLAAGDDADDAAARESEARTDEFLGTIKVEGTPDGTGTVEDPIFVGGDIERAAHLIQQGKHVRLAQPDEIATIISKLSALALDAENRGETAPAWDPCQMSVAGTNLFCVENQGLARTEMPQLSGVPTPGSPADGFPKDKRGEVDLGSAFRQWLTDSHGIAVTDESVPASHLRATQKEMKGNKVAGMIDSLRIGRLPPGRIFVTRDHYVVDGHHRWAANVAVDTEDGDLGDVTMDVARIDLDIGAVLDLANEYAADMGIGRANVNKEVAPIPAPAPPGNTPLSDYQYQAHAAWLEEKAAELYKAGQTTDVIYTTDPDRMVYTPERAAQHKELIDAMWERAASVPSEGRAVISGGLGGAGKSSVLRHAQDVAPSDQFFTVNADDVKEEMAKRGMFPTVEGMSPMEASTLGHAEASYLAELLAERAYAERKNLVWDMTMAEDVQLRQRVAGLRSHGYTDITGLFVDIDVETSVERALRRHREDMNRLRQTGEGFGGRYVPPWIIRESAASDASSANRKVFDGNRSLFDHGSVWSTMGPGPVRVEAFDNDSTEDPTQSEAYVGLRTHALSWAVQQGWSTAAAQQYATWYAAHYSTYDPQNMPPHNTAVQWYPGPRPGR